MTTTDPTPEQALTALSVALPEDDATVTRRRFLQAAGAGVAIGTMPGWMDGLAAAASPLGPSQGVVVLITQDGGNDALDTVVPIADGAYRDRRRALAIPAERTLRLDGRRGMHPALVHLKSRWDQGHVAVIDGVGLASQNLSHFSAMAEVMHGAPTSGIPRTGWLGRYLDGLGGDPLRGVSIGRRVPLVITGAKTSGTALPSSRHRVTEAKPQHAAVYQGLAAMGAGTSGLGRLGDSLADVGARMMDASRTLRPLYPEPGSMGDLASELALAAGLINADLGIRVITVHHGGYDSHAGQSQQHGTRMAELDEALRVFDATLKPAFRSRSLVLCMSEFGRRVDANGSAGTDHGAAYSAIAVGDGVRGGFHGALPSLQHLSRRGNLVPAVDPRQVTATVLDRWLGADSRAVLGSSQDGIDFLRGFTADGSGGTGRPAGGFKSEHADVLRLYRAFFDREPDGGGARYWVDAFEGGLSLEGIAQAFTGSAEFAAMYAGTDDATYVSRVYRHVLGRDYDQAGFDYWLGLVRNGTLTRGRLVRVIAASPEFVARAPYTRMP